MLGSENRFQRARFEGLLYELKVLIVTDVREQCWTDAIRDTIMS
jgi:hypothetical protein